jgi:hypothetical protein
MADSLIEFIQGDFGDSYVVTIKNPDGTNADISTYTTATFNLVTKDLLTSKFSTTCSISSPNVTWTMTSLQTADLDGSYVGQIVLTKSGNQKATKLIDVKAHRKLIAS